MIENILKLIGITLGIALLSILLSIWEVQHEIGEADKKTKKWQQESYTEQK